MKVKNIEAAKKLLEKYKSITLEELKEKYEKHIYITGKHVLNAITGFSNIKDCILCQEVHCICSNCIYSFRRDIKKMEAPCTDIIYQEMAEAMSAEKLYNTIQKRISYLTHIIEWYETLGSEKS